jgi:hypothetical protein
MTSPRFTYNDVVRVLPSARAEARPGAKAWVVGVFAESRPGEYFSRFPDGIVYSIEFEDGSSLEVHESELQFEN